MPDKKISELTAATTPLAGTEEAEIVQGGVNKRVPVSEFGTSAAAILTTTITNGDTTHAPDGNSVFDALALKSNVTPAARSGTAIQFDVSATYGTFASPESGNITYNSSGAVIGVVQLLIHALYNSTPTFGSEFVLLGEYTPTETNYIYMELIAGGKILTEIKVGI